MKTKLLTLITLWIATSMFAFAQEETEPTPDPQLGLRGAEATLRPEPSVSVPTENEKPAYPKPGQQLATPKPTPASSPSASKKASPASSPAKKMTAKASPAPSPAKKMAAKAPPAPTPVKKVAAKPSPAPSRKAAVAAKPRPAKSTTSAAKKSAPAGVRESENRWAEATSQHDVAAIQELIAGDYVGVTPSGRILNKAGLIAELRKDKNVYTSVTNPQMDVRAHGTATVVVGMTRQKGKNAAGKAFAYTYRWTDTWVERDGRWVCVASQSIRLPG